MKKRYAFVAAMMFGAVCFAFPVLAENTSDLQEQETSEQDENEEKERIEGVWTLAYMEKEEDEEPTSVKDKDSWLVFTDESDEPEFVLILSGDEMLKGTWAVYEDVDDAYVLTPEKEQEDAVAGMFCPAGKLYEEEMFVIDISEYFLFFTKAPEKDPRDFLNRPAEETQTSDGMEETIIRVEEAVEDTYSGT